MELQAEQKDPRFYYIRVMDLQIFNGSEFKSNVAMLKMHVGSKYSETTFVLSDFKVEKSKSRINDEAHVFGYGAEEFMNLYLEEGESKKAQVNTKSKQKNSISGYCRILLPPLIQYPHICHKIKAKLVGLKNKIQITKTLIGVITLQLYYRLDFHAQIEIIPISGHLDHNVAQIGDMKPIIELKIGDQGWTSLESDGIHPKWSGHFHAKKEKIEETGFVKINNLKNNVDHNRRTLEDRQTFHNNNLLTKQEYFDVARFSLASASSFMTIKVYSFPLIGKSPDITGTTQIRISNEGFLMHPQSQYQPYFVQKDVNLFYQEEEETKIAGYLTFLIRFIFDKNNVLDCGPHVLEMPRPQVEVEEDTGKKFRKQILGGGESRLSAK